VRPSRREVLLRPLAPRSAFFGCRLAADVQGEALRRSAVITACGRPTGALPRIPGPCFPREVGLFAIVFSCLRRLGAPRGHPSSRSFTIVVHDCRSRLSFTIVVPDMMDVDPTGRPRFVRALVPDVLSILTTDDRGEAEIPVAARRYRLLLSFALTSHLLHGG
jgi:hypothetical protein